MTHCELVLKTLKEHPEGLSHRELNNLTGLPACSKRISELRDQGWDIPDVPIPGSKKKYGRYVLKGKIGQAMAVFVKKEPELIKTIPVLTEKPKVESNQYRCLRDPNHLILSYTGEEYTLCPRCNYRYQARRV